MEKINNNNPFIHYYYLINKTNSTIRTTNNKLNTINNLNDIYRFSYKQKVKCDTLPAGIRRENMKTLEKVFFKKLYKFLFLYNFLLNGWEIQIIDEENIKMIKKS
jgi:hypothetical protein